MNNKTTKNQPCCLTCNVTCCIYKGTNRNYCDGKEIEPANDFKRCKNGHYYQGDACPYCPTQYGNSDARSIFYDAQETEINIPVCSHCGYLLRKEIPKPKEGYVGSIQGDAYDGKVPWNYEWNGKCEHCGHDYNISMWSNIPTFEGNRNKMTTVKVSARGVMRSLTQPQIICVSGVEIESRMSGSGVEKLFLSTNELKYLMEIFKNSPILKQLDSNQSMW
ncbi:MAG: hypothetical protein LBJ63_10550 [Prevotellaceae bacterium]|jgi:hypothetical protein|nr:hypothetical protein [Prevotellaceae bacterium]